MSDTEQKQIAETIDGTARSPVDFRDAYRSVDADKKRKAFIMLGAAGAAMAVLLISRLLWLFEPLLDKIYYGTLSEIIYYIMLAVLFVPFVIGLNIFVKRYTAERIFLPQKKSLSFTRALGIITIGAVTVFIAGAVFDFKLKIQLEMGMGVTIASALTNITVYFYYALHLWLGLTAAALVQRALTVLFPAKYEVPWGAIFLVAVFGITELILEYATTDHMYPWLYYMFTYAYAAIYVLSGHSFHLTYWASVVILVL